MDERSGDESAAAKARRATKRGRRIAAELAEDFGLELDPVAREELVHCRHVDPHEGHRPEYGAVTWSTTAGSPGPPSALVNPSLATLSVEGPPVEVLRHFANGRTSFIMRRGEQRPSLAIDPAWIGDVRTLAADAQMSGATVVQRTSSGRIHVFVGGRVLMHDGTEWFLRPTVPSYVDAAAPLVEARDRPILDGILDLCVNSLGPAGIGATIVWFPEGFSPDAEGLRTDAAFEPPPLLVHDQRYAPAIVQALSQLDRAVVVESTGRMVLANVTLTGGDERVASTSSGGTRHESASRFSAMHPSALVVVVSADGPVTLFNGGRPIGAAVQDARTPPPA